MSLYDNIQKIKVGEEEPDCERNRMLADMVQFIAEQNRPFFIGGGLALVFSSDKMYRCHKDIDVFFLPEDRDFWLGKLGEYGVGFIENTDRRGYPIIRITTPDMRTWIGDIKFVSKGDIADDGNPHRVITNHIAQWVIPTHAPEYVEWQKANQTDITRPKDSYDLNTYLS